MRVFTLLLVLSVFSCASPTKHQTASYKKYAHKHHKIAILPAIFEDKKFTENISDDEKKKNTFT